MTKKIIGISPRFWSNDTQEFVRVSTHYIKQLQHEAIVPLILVETPNLENILSMCDAFLIIGGDDINPTCYGEDNSLGLSKDIYDLVDNIDKAIINHAVTNKKPVFGICRGIQAIGAFMNCKLSQDLKHDNLNHPLLEEHKHMVQKVNNFGVCKLLPNEFLVNTYHHQAVKEVNEDFVVLLKNGDVIEAIQHKELPIFGVQWHPERFVTEESRIIFDYFFSLIK